MPKLTQSFIASVKANDTDQWIADSDVPGMYLRIQTSGRKTIVIRYRNQYGRGRKYTVARVQDAPIAQLRDLAREHLLSVRKGSDPAESKRTIKEKPTMAELGAMYLAECRVAKKPNTIRLYEYLLRKWIVPSIGKMRAEELTPQHISRMRDTYGSVAPMSANKAVKLVRALFAFGAERNLCVGNPATLVKLYSEKRTRKGLSADALRRIIDYLHHPDTNDGFRRLVLLLMHTGCRVSEIATARTSWLQGNVLHLPDTKTGARSVTLSDAAMSLVDRRQPYLCGRAINHPHDMMRKMRKKIGLHEFTYHQLRHTYASVAVDAGMSIRDVATLLGHSSMNTTLRYVHSVNSTNVERVSASLDSFLNTKAHLSAG
jgi:integrase